MSERQRCWWMDPLLFALVSSLYAMLSYPAADHYFKLIMASIFIWHLARKQISIQCFLKMSDNSVKVIFPRLLNLNCLVWIWEKKQKKQKQKQSLKLPYHIINRDIYLNHFKSIILSAKLLQAWQTALYALNTLSLFPWMSTKLDGWGKYGAERGRNLAQKSFVNSKAAMTRVNRCRLGASGRFVQPCW